MVYPKFNENKAQSTFDNMYGKGSFNSGMNRAREIGRSTAQVKIEQSNYTQRLKAVQKAAKEAQQANKYDNIFGGTTVNKNAAKQIDDMIKNPKKNGASRNANSVRNDPSLQAELKSRGYSVNKFVDAMYNASSGGKFKSEREFNQFAGGLKKQATATKKQDNSTQGLIDKYSNPTQNKSSAIAKKSSNNGGGLSGLFNNLKNSEVGHAVTAAGQFFNPFDGVKAEDAVNTYLNHKPSKTAQEVQRGANRAVDSASLGAMSNLDKKVNKRTPYYNSQRSIGKGGGTDMVTTGIGYLVPGLGATKAVKGTMFGAKTGLTGLAKLGSIAKEGAIVGGAVPLAQTGINYALNPKDQSLKDNAINVITGAALGAVGDPLLHGAGQLGLRGLSKFAKGDVPTFTGKPSQSVLDSLAPLQKGNINKNNTFLDNLVNSTPKNNFEIPVRQGKMSNSQPSLQDALKNSLKPVMAKNPKLIDNAQQGYLSIEAMKGNSDPGIVPKPINQDIPYKQGDQLPDTLSHIQSKTKKELPSIGNLKTKAYIKTVDNLHALNQFDKTVENVLGHKLNPSQSSYTLGLNSRGSDQISKQILTQNMVNKSGDVVGPSLKDIASQIPKNKLPQFEDYLVNKHAITRMNRGEKVFPDLMQMNAAKSEAKVMQYEAQHPEFKDLSNKYYEYNKQLGKTWLVDTGVLSEKQWNQYLKANPNYVPNNRIFKDIEKGRFSNIAKKGFANQSDPTNHKAVGSERPIVSPIETTIEHTDKYVKTAKRNEVMQSLINNIKQDPEAFKGWAEIVPTKDTPQDIVQTLQKDGVDGVLNNFNLGFDQKPDLTKGNVVFGLIDGKKVHVKVHDPQLLDAITNLSPQGQHSVVKAVGQLTRVMKNLTTGINPVFSLTRNIWRDIPTAYINSKSTNNPLTFGKDLVGSVVSVLKNDELYRSFKAVGGGHSSPISSDVNLLAQSKRTILPGQKGLFNGVKKIGGKGLGALENLNNAVESAPRLAEFKRLTNNNNSYDAKMKGLFEANDVTVNFNKHGNFTKELDAFIPYMNAAIQGLNKTYRSVKDQPLKMAVKGLTAITIPSIVLYAVNHNNPDYQNLSNYIKDNNFLIPNRDGTFTKIPKPRELGPAFGSDVERLLRMWKDQDPKAFEGFGKTVLENFMPPTRTILHPALVDTVANKNFAGVPIVPGDLQNLSPKYQYDSKTSEVAKGIGNIFNVSPKKVDYLAKSYGGVLGELGIPATTKDATIGDTLKQKVTADPVFSNDLMMNFYDKKTKLDQARNDLVKQGVVSNNLNEEQRKIMNSASNDMAKIRKAIKETQNDNTLTPKDRKARIRELQKVMNNIASSTLNTVR